MSTKTLRLLDRNKQNQQLKNAMRMSRLPLTLLCPASSVDDGQIMVGSRGAADLGSAVHWWVGRRIAGEQLEIEDVAAKFGVDADDLIPISLWTWRAWKALAEHFPDPQVETTVVLDGPDGDITGHTDVLSHADGCARICDFKTGRLDADATAQIKAYCLGAMRQHDCHTSYALIIRPRDMVAYGTEYTRKELEEWWDGVVETLKATNVFSPGSHCSFCPRSATCPSKTALLRQAVDSLTDMEFEFDGSAPMPNGEHLPDDPEVRGPLLAAVLERIKLVDRVSEVVRDLIKADVERHGGSMPAGEGRQLVVIEQEQKKIAFGPAWPVLQKVIPAELLNECVTVSKTKIEDAIRERVGKGQNGKAVADVMESLRQVGAISTKKIHRLEFRKALKLLEVA